MYSIFKMYIKLVFYSCRTFKWLLRLINAGWLHMGGHGDLPGISFSFLGDCVTFMRHKILNQIFLVTNSMFVSVHLWPMQSCYSSAQDKSRVGESNDIILPLRTWITGWEGQRTACSAEQHLLCPCSWTGITQPGHTGYKCPQQVCLGWWVCSL